MLHVIHIELVAHVVMPVCLVDQDLLRLLSDHICKGLSLLPIDDIDFTSRVWTELHRVRVAHRCVLYLYKALMLDFLEVLGLVISQVDRLVTLVFILPAYNVGVDHSICVDRFTTIYARLLLTKLLGSLRNSLELFELSDSRLLLLSI